MDTKQEIIRRYFRENDSERKIARDLQINRKTVKKYLNEYLNEKSKLENSDDTEKLQEYCGSAPKYEVVKRQKRKLHESIIVLIDKLLAENEHKKNNGLRKQIKRKVDIHEFIVSQGFSIGYTTVCNFIRQRELISREAYIRQHHLPGEECEFDWGEFKIYIAGELKRFYMAVFTSSYSNYRFAMIFSRQDQLAFMESHNEFFKYVGGVFHEMVYDNMRVAVAQFVGQNEKVPTKALTNMSGWFQFRWRFCNVRRGNEKGSVERSVEVIRRNAFCDKDRFDTVEQAQQHLLKTVTKLNNQSNRQTNTIPAKKLETEKGLFWQYPGTMHCYLTEMLKVDKYSTFSCKTNHYSAPDYLVGKIVEVKIFSNQLKVYYNNDLVCNHERSYDKHQWTIDLEHYLRTLSRKPGALHGSEALRQAPKEVREVYERFFTHRPRQFVEIMRYCKDNLVPHKKLISIVYEVYRICPNDVSNDKIIALLGNQAIDYQINTNNTFDEIEAHSLQQLKDMSIFLEPSVNQLEHATRHT